MAGPVLIELCRLLGDDVDRLETIDDAGLYRDIIFAVRLRYSTDDFSARLVPELDEMSARVLRRLRRGWFADRGLRSPQSWFSGDGEIGAIMAGNGSPDSVLGEKPTGALWTTSFLPNGESAWELLEQAEFSDRNRSVFSVHFAENETLVHTIDSLSDYRQLVLEYPRPLAAGRVGVRWDDVARDFHAVHLTAHGLVTTHDVTIVTPHGVASLRGWDSESTAWLRRPPACTVARQEDAR